MARLFYNYETAGDCLYLIVAPEVIPDRIEKKGNTVVLYKGEELVGVNFLQFSKILKIKASGMLTSIPEPVANIVSLELEKAGVTGIDLNSPSGYYVATILSLEEHPLDEKKQIVDLSLCGTKLECSSRYQNLAVGDKVVVITDGAIKFDGTMFHKSVIRNIPQDCELCSEADLHLGDDFKNAVHSNLEEGTDFFC